jgi:hypothetical protein
MFLYQDKVSAISSSVAEINFMMISSQSYAASCISKRQAHKELFRGKEEEEEEEEEEGLTQKAVVKPAIPEER